jgi:hypothetical protein
LQNRMTFGLALDWTMQPPPSGTPLVERTKLSLIR